MKPIGWIAFFWEGGEVVRRSSKDVDDPRALPASNCLGARVFYEETTRAAGKAIHYSDVYLCHDWIEFYRDGDRWNCRNADEVIAERADHFKEGVQLPDEEWYRVMRERFFNNVDNEYGRW